MDLSILLKQMGEKGASDLFLTAGVPPTMKVNGKDGGSLKRGACSRSLYGNRYQHDDSGAA